MRMKNLEEVKHQAIALLAALPAGRTSLTPTTVRTVPGDLSVDYAPWSKPPTAFGEASRRLGSSIRSQVHRRYTRTRYNYELFGRNGKRLVEAAGVEPASEKVRRAKPTCVSGSYSSEAAYKTGKSGSRLVRLISTLDSGPKSGAYPAK